MNTTTFSHATPATRYGAPGRTFGSLRQATTFTIEASEHWRVAYLLWQSHAGLLTHLARYHPDRRSLC